MRRSDIQGRGPTGPKAARASIRRRAAAVLALSGLAAGFATAAGAQSLDWLSRLRAMERDALDAAPSAPSGTQTAQTAPEGGAVVLDPVLVEGAAPTSPPGAEPTGASESTGYRPRRTQGSTKTSTPILDTPHAVQVIPSQVIFDQRAQSQDEILRNAPSVSRTQNQGNVAGSQNNAIRGFNTRSVYKDGARYSTIGLVYLDNIESVEVVKGPASMLYGAIQPGGLIAYNRKKPQKEAAYSLGLGYGSYETFTPTFDLTGPLLPGGKLAYRLIGSYEVGESELDFYDRKSAFIAPAIRYQDDRLVVDLTYEYGRTRETFIYGHPVLGFRPDKSLPRSLFLGEPGQFKITEDQTYAFRADYDVLDATKLRTLFNYSRFTHESQAFRPGTFNAAAGT